MSSVNTLMKLASLIEKRGLSDDLSYKMAKAIREVNMAAGIREAKADSNIEVESWPDFLNWWNNNRGQNLVYIFMDTYGPDSKQVSLVKKLVRDAEKHEKDLHEFYRTLRDLASRSMTMEQQQGVSKPNQGNLVTDNMAPQNPDDLDQIALDLGE